MAPLTELLQLPSRRNKPLKVFTIVPGSVTVWSSRLIIVGE